jgi:hypothetical protein
MRKFETRSLSPEVLEPVRRQRRVDGRAGDRAMAEPPLDSPGVVALVREGVSAGVPQHVRVRLELQAGARRGALAPVLGRERGRCYYLSKPRVASMSSAFDVRCGRLAGAWLFISMSATACGRLEDPS